MTKQEINKRIDQLSNRAHDNIDHETLMYYGLPNSLFKEYEKLNNQLQKMEDN